MTDAPDGKRIAELLASEVTGRTDGVLGRLRVVDVRDLPEDLDADPDGTLAYGVALDRGGADPDRIADVYALSDRVRIAVRDGLDALPEAAERADLPVRATPAEPVASVESGAAVKRAFDVLRAVARAAAE